MILKNQTSPSGLQHDHKQFGEAHQLFAADPVKNSKNVAIISVACVIAGFAVIAILIVWSRRRRSRRSGNRVEYNPEREVGVEVLHGQFVL
jgi:heme A synthase